ASAKVTLLFEPPKLLEKKLLFFLENLTSIDLYQSKGPLYLYIYSPSHGPTILPSRSQTPNSHARNRTQEDKKRSQKAGKST
ncbi:MAG: hypothetical protein ACI4BG_09675, partial [Prevotella sp.]